MQQYLTPGLIISVLLHILLAFSMTRENIPLEAPSLTIDAFIFPEASTVKKQIVSPSDSEQTDSTSTDTNLLSDRETSVAEQRLKRGDDPRAGQNPGSTESTSNPAMPTKQTKQTLQKSVAKEQNNRQSSDSLSPPESSAISKPLDLNLRPDYLKNLSRPEQAKGTRPTPLQAAPDARPFSRAPGAGALLLGFNGNSDFLPDVRDGDITLLNAKADKYAVFVRRVAIRVFHLLKQYGWNYMRASEFQSLRRYTKVRATLSSEGDFVAISLEDSSGNSIFDDLVSKSVQEGSSDPNPPPDALTTDGTYRFIFLARSWTQASSGRSGALRERRWLSLQTGLE